MPLPPDLLAAVHDLCSRYGEEAAADSRRAAGFLADAVGGRFVGERGVLLVVLQEGLPRRMFAGERFSDAAVRDHARHIAAVHLIREDAVRAAAECWRSAVAVELARPYNRDVMFFVAPSSIPSAEASPDSSAGPGGEGEGPAEDLPISPPADGPGNGPADGPRPNPGVMFYIPADAHPFRAP